jgi:hypothetical protein
VEAHVRAGAHNQRIAAHKGFDFVELLALARQLERVPALRVDRDMERAGQLDGGKCTDRALLIDDAGRGRLRLAGLAGDAASARVLRAVFIVVPFEYGGAPGA